MNSEYIRLNYGEQVFAQKNMLNSQLELLNGIKRLQAYRNLREKEFKLKIELKSKIGMLLDDLKTLEKNLPEVEDSFEYGKKENRKESLEQEIEEIRRKLERLS